MKIRVGVNGYGNIGKRVAYAVMRQDDMELIGVTKSQPNYTAHGAKRRGHHLYAVNQTKPFEDEGISTKGTVKDLIQACDVIVDCSPGGVGQTNLPLYEQNKNLKVIFQGGEHEQLAPISFNAQSNYDTALGKKLVRVVSCNTTALTRIISTLEAAYGVKKARAAIVRRSSDPNAVKKVPLNAWLPSMHSHHAKDVKMVMPHINISTIAGIAPTTLMHGHMLFMQLKEQPQSVQAAIDILKANPRLALLPPRRGIESTGQLKDLASEAGREHGDIFEACIWQESVHLDDGELFFHVAVDQQAVVIPENVDAIRAVMSAATKEESMKRTDESLGIGSLSF